MTQPLRLGWKASAEQFGPRPLLDFAVLAEELGFDSVMVSDHFSPWRHTDGHAPFSLAWLAALGERTQRVLMGTSVLTPTFRYHPAVVAQAFGTLGLMYPERIVLGVGTGESLNEVPLGFEWPDFRGRFRRLSEAVTLMRRLWTEELVDFDGEYYHVDDATVYDRPEKPVPVYLAASGEVVARFAGRQGDGLICTSGKGIELYRDKLLPAVREGAEVAGRDYDAIEKTAIFHLDVGENGEKVDAIIGQLHWLAGMGIQTVIVGVKDVWRIKPLEIIGERVIPAVANLEASPVSAS